MNERIRKLAEQATSKPHRSQGFGGEPTHIYPGTLDPEKFAELILRECKLFCGHDSDGVSAMFKHFGVQE